MDLQIAKWGNSLALRIPAEYVQVDLTIDVGLSIRASKWDRSAFARELETTRETMPLSQPVIDELRRGERY
jgi:antitoxin MazE